MAVGQQLSPEDVKRGSDKVNGPARGFLDVTAQAHDSNNLRDVITTGNLIAPRGILVRTGGNITLRFIDGSSLSYVAVVAETILPYAANGGWLPSYVVGINATGLTAAGLFAVM